MNQFWKDVWISMVMGLILPAVLLAAVVSIGADRTETIQETLPVSRASEETVTVTQATAPQIQVTILTSDEVIKELPLDSYLTCVVLAEMPVSFEEEALKAQSVVARTYTIRAAQNVSKHDMAAVCTNSSCCQAYMDEETFLKRGGTSEDIARIRRIVAETDGQVLTYDGKLIEATYFSCSGGTTEDAVAVWGTDVPYLQSVSSPGEEHAAHYTDTVTFPAEDFAAKLGIPLSGKPASWFGHTTYTDGNGIATMSIGGENFTGTQLRKLLGLRSTAFEIETDSNSVTITTHGYGHRVGMSQYGADAMAASGSTYPEILAYYYQGTELEVYTD